MAVDTEEIINQIKALEVKIQQLTDAQKGTGDKWCTYGYFAQANRIGRTRLNTLIAQGKIEVDKTMSHTRYLYRWAA